MPTQEAVQYLTKADAARLFRRSERSLSRDITNAVKAADRDVLAHVRLRLENGSVRPGIEVTIDQIISLRDEDRQNPKWELETDWLETRYGRRGDTPQEEDEGAGTGPVVPVGDRPTAEEDAIGPRELPAEPALRAAVLQATNAELEKRTKAQQDHIHRLETELDRRAEERREENELQKQNNILMQQIYNMLDKMQSSSGEVNVLPPPSRRARSLPVSATADGQAEVVGAAASETVEPARVPGEETRPAAKSARKKKRPTARRRTPAAKREASTQPKKAKAVKVQPRKLFPTFDKAFRSIFHR